MGPRLSPVAFVIILAVILVPSGHFLFCGLLLLLGDFILARRLGLLLLRIEVLVLLCHVRLLTRVMFDCAKKPFPRYFEPGLQHKVHQLSSQPPVFRAGPYRAFEIGVGDSPLLQRFYESNPEYHFAVGGQAPGPSEARDEFETALPAAWPYTKRWMLVFLDEHDSMIGMASVVSDLFAKGIWHLGLFIVATPLHGRGAARILNEHLESWMRDNGARWVRLGVVEGNSRAERFWERSGYFDIRKRHGVEMGQRTNTLRVMARPLANGSVKEYLAAVARDRPDSP